MPENTVSSYEISGVLIRYYKRHPFSQAISIPKNARDSIMLGGWSLYAISLQPSGIAYKPARARYMRDQQTLSSNQLACKHTCENESPKLLSASAARGQHNARETSASSQLPTGQHYKRAREFSTTLVACCTPPPNPRSLTASLAPLSNAKKWVSRETRFSARSHIVVVDRIEIQDRGPLRDRAI